MKSDAKGKFSPWHSIKTRVTLLTLVIFIVSLTSLSYYVSRLVQADLQRVLGEQQFALVSQEASDVNDHVQERLDALELVAQNLTPVMPQGVTAAAQRTLENLPIFQALFNAGSFVTGPDGTVIASVPASEGRIGVNVMDRDHIAAALTKGRSFVGKPVPGKLSQHPVVSMAVPILDPLGKPMGALVGVIDLGQPNFLDQSIKTLADQSATVSIIAAQHRVTVTSSDKKLVLFALPAPGVNPYLDRNIAGFEGSTLVVNVLGQEQLASVKQIPAAQWYLFSGQSTQAVFAPVRALQQRMLWATVVLSLLAVLLTWWLLRHQLAPVFETARKLVRLAESDDIPPPLPIVRQDEIGELVGAFNHLLQTVGQRDAALKDSQQNLAITLNSIGDAVIATDTAGRITRMNPAAVHLTGWPLADALGQPLTEVFRIVNAQTRLPVANPVELVMAHGEVVGLANHTVLLARDGREYQIADSAAPIRNAPDQIVGVVLVFSDVSEKYQAEAALLKHKNALNEAQRLAHMGSWELDTASNQISLSDELLRIYGFDPALPPLSLSDLEKRFTPESWNRSYAAMKQTAATGLPYELELEVVGRQDGKRGWVLARGEVVRDASGSIVGFRGTATDITERQQAQAKLQLAASVFEHAGEGILITDTQGTILDVNAGFTRITGYSREQAIGQNPRILKSGRQDNAFYETMWRDLTERGHWSGEIWNRHQDGSVYAELLTISASRDAHGDVRQYVCLFSDITAIKNHQNELQHLAHFDALTNLPNRVLLADRLQQAMAQAQRRQQQVAVIYLDLDGFKDINDRHGHDSGDQMLIMLAECMNEVLREGDTLARFGGDEFVVVLTDLDSPADCLPLVKRLLTVVAQPRQVNGRNLQVSASLGITFFPQAKDIDAEQLLRQADQAMYQAKVAGKNRYHIFDAAQDSNIREHHESLERIRQALAHGELVLYYQPKVNMRTGKVIGAEALIRWQHPEKGLLAPAVFLPVIEEHALAIDVGEWVIDTALQQMQAWHAVGLDLPVSVNIGARQLQQGDFVQRLQAILAKHPQVQPGCIELEILETSALSDIAQVSQVIEDCAQFGVTFALDDFGTGYSSLIYLKRLRVAMLKIDQSFVRDMLDDPDDMAILQGVIGLAAAFKHKVIAEGVETVAHGTALLQLGCELAQGYGIARPMPVDQLPAWVTKWQPDAAWTQ